MIDSSNNRTVDHDKHELRGIRKDGTEFHMDMTMAFMTE